MNGRQVSTAPWSWRDRSRAPGGESRPRRAGSRDRPPESRSGCSRPPPAGRMLRRVRPRRRCSARGCSRPSPRSIDSIASAISRPASAACRRAAWPGSGPANTDTSAPALNARPRPLTITTLTSDLPVHPAGRLGELPQRLGAERVELLRPVEGDRAPVAVGRHLDRAEGHAAPYRRRLARPSACAPRARVRGVSLLLAGAVARRADSAQRPEHRSVPDRCEEPAMRTLPQLAARGIVPALAALRRGGRAGRAGKRRLPPRSSSPATCSGTRKAAGSAVGQLPPRCPDQGAVRGERGQGPGPRQPHRAARGGAAGGLRAERPRSGRHSSLEVSGSVVVERAATVVLGCEPEESNCVDDPDSRRPNPRSRAPIGSPGACGAPRHSASSCTTTMSAGASPRSGEAAAPTATPAGSSTTSESPTTATTRTAPSAEASPSAGWTPAGWASREWTWART